jgi:hypothetical protein
MREKGTSVVPFKRNNRCAKNGTTVARKATTVVPFKKETIGMQKRNNSCFIQKGTVGA